ncbi:hypothetical protein C8R44DRAFT_887017 [Mycena epipterygia]|nr:hypothetical protein C8R44DRAFT_887017 [Mycena epipterygia]
MEMKEGGAGYWSDFFFSCSSECTIVSARNTIAASSRFRVTGTISLSLSEIPLPRYCEKCCTRFGPISGSSRPSAFIDDSPLLGALVVAGSPSADEFHLSVPRPACVISLYVSGADRDVSFARFTALASLEFLGFEDDGDESNRASDEYYSTVNTTGPILPEAQSRRARFIPQTAYEAPHAWKSDVVARVFMIFKSVLELDVVADEWNAEAGPGDPARWREVVGVDVGRAGNASSFRVLEWGAPYVRNVHIMLSTGFEANQHWQSVLRALTHIESLELRGFVSAQTELSGSLLALVFEVLKRPCFDRLYLRVLAVPHAFMACTMSSVRTVLLQNVTITDAAAAADTPSVDPPRLEHLFLPGNNIRDSQIRGVLELLQIRSSISSSAMTPRFPLAFPPLPALRYFELRINLGRNGALLPGLDTTLAALAAAAPGIHTLTFTSIYIHPEAAAGTVALFNASATCRAALPHLHRVRFRVLFNQKFARLSEDSLEDDFRAFVAGIEAGLPALLGTGLLEFDWGISS